MLRYCNIRKPTIVYVQKYSDALIRKKWNGRPRYGNEMLRFEDQIKFQTSYSTFREI